MNHRRFSAPGTKASQERFSTPCTKASLYYHRRDLVNFALKLSYITRTMYNI